MTAPCNVCGAVDVVDQFDHLGGHTCRWCVAAADFENLLAHAARLPTEPHAPARMPAWQQVWLSRWLRARDTA